MENIPDDGRSASPKEIEYSTGATTFDFCFEVAKRICGPRSFMAFPSFKGLVGGWGTLSKEEQTREVKRLTILYNFFCDIPYAAYIKGWWKVPNPVTGRAYFLCQICLTPRTNCN
jgi:hypothetical protein